METDLGTLATIGKAFADGGIWMWAILAVQVVSIAIIIERVVALYILRRPNQKNYAERFEQDIRRGEINAVISNAQRMRFINPVANVIEAGAVAARDMGGRDEIQAKMDEVLLAENAKLERRTGFLAMLGNVGTLLGLLGTIVGLIGSFGSVASVNPVEKAAMLTQGISMAMNTTAYGLIMAIPALVMFAVLQNRANRIAEDLNQGSLKIFNWLSFNYETVDKSKRASRSL